jgi:predicted ATP-grasp superfamily ATP-dependent carboligase
MGRDLGATAKTLGALLLLQVPLPANAALTALATLHGLFVRQERTIHPRPQTILLSGGKMTKALQLARSFHAAGHRVILVEASKYRFAGHRFSRGVDRFYAVPAPGDPSYGEAMVDIVRREHVDVYVPVCSPASSYYDALIKPLLAPYCSVLHGDAETIKLLDDKYEFAMTAMKLGLPVPRTERVTAPEQVAAAAKEPAGAPYVLKSIAYDPVHRLDLTPLPRPSVHETSAIANAKPISDANPWILQQFVDGTEYCTHATVRHGHMQVYCCCASSAFQLNYEMVDKPEIEDWVRRFVDGLGLTGQVSFDFIEAADGRLYAIECNPRTHSAITMFYNHPDLAGAYLDDDVPMIRPLVSSRPTYWTYWELWRLLSQPRTFRTRFRTLRQGKDAIFDWNDPLPFLLEHHLQIPLLLLRNLISGRDWIRIDFNIGKLVEAGGD